MNRKIHCAMAVIASVLILAGCGIGDVSLKTDQDEVMDIMPMTMTESPEEGHPEEEQPESEELKLVYFTGMLSEEEEEAVFEHMKTLFQNLELEDYIGEGIHMVSSQEWLESMGIRLYEGSRSYFLQKGITLLLSVQVGLSSADEAYTSIFFPGRDGESILLTQAGTVTQLLFTGISEDGYYDGAFQRWQIDSATGSILMEQGVYSRGILTGNYTVSSYEGQPGDAFDLWNNRDNFEYETVTTEYDEQGIPVPTATPEPTPTPTRKPAAQTTSRPQTTASPAPAPDPDSEPEPPEPETPAPPVPEQPTEPPVPATEAPSEGNGGDVDIEWSDDIL